MNWDPPNLEAQKVLSVKKVKVFKLGHVQIAILLQFFIFFQT